MPDPRRRAARRAGAWLVNASLSLTVSLGLLAALEGLARRYERPALVRPLADTHGLDWQAEWQADFFVMKSTSVGWPPWEDFNRDGLRDRPHVPGKSRHTHRVMCLGDSVTLGYGFPRAQAWPQVLQRLLDARGPGTEVFNMALIGWSTRQERYAYERIGRRYHPDSVVLAVVLNDVEDLQNNLSRPPLLISELFRRSALVRRLVDAEGREIGSIEELFARPEPPKVSRGYERLFDELRRLAEDVRDDGATLTVVVCPDADQVGPRPPPPVPEERIAAFARKEGLPLVDPLPGLRRIGPSAYTDRVHFTPRGSTEVAEEVLADAIPPAAYSTESLRESLAASGEADDPARASVRTLAALAADGSPDLRREVAWAVARQGPHASAAVPFLVSALHDPEATVRAEAARALSAMGSIAGPAVSDLLSLLRDSDAEARWAAADALAAIGFDPAAHLSALRDALGSDDAYVRGFAAWTVGLGGPSAVEVTPALESLLRDPEPGVRILAVRALGNLQSDDPTVSAALSGTIRNETGDIRWRAARALAKLGPAAAPATEALQAALLDSDPRIRRESALALAAIGPAASGAVPALVRAERDDMLEVREAAEKAVRRITAHVASASPR